MAATAKWYYYYRLTNDHGIESTTWFSVFACEDCKFDVFITQFLTGMIILKIQDGHQPTTKTILSLLQEKKWQLDIKNTQAFCCQGF